MPTKQIRPVRPLLQLASLLFIFLSLTMPGRAEQLHVYCDHWPRFCENNGQGFYLDLVNTIYQPYGYTIIPHIVPYKRASAIVNYNKGDMLLGVYKGELDNVLMPTYPDSADDIVVIMLKKWEPDWHGESSLTKQSVIWPRGWALEKYLTTSMRWHEVENNEIAIQLLERERYRYYITVGALYPASKTPTNIHREFIRWIPTYPAFGNNERGNQLRHIWDQEMVKLIRTGGLDNIYRRYHLYENYQKFIAELADKVRYELDDNDE